MSGGENTTGRLVESQRRRENSATGNQSHDLNEPPGPTAGAHDDRSRSMGGRQLIFMVLGCLAFMGIVSLLILALPVIRAPATPIGIAAPAAVTQPQAPTSQQAAFSPAATGAVVAGTVKYTGKPITPKLLSTASDPYCKVPVFSEDIVAKANGTLSNVLVYVTQGLGGRRFTAPAAPLMMDTRGFRIVPHVLGVQVGQPVLFRNSDPSPVNWHVAANRNIPSNRGQPKLGMTFTNTFTTPEVPIRVRDDVHPWKSGYICVVGHPFFNVTNSAGVFRLEGLPPGTYTIESWHEKLGTTQQTVTVKNGDIAKITITY